MIILMHSRDKPLIVFYRGVVGWLYVFVYVYGCDAEGGMIVRSGSTSEKIRFLMVCGVGVVFVSLARRGKGGMVFFLCVCLRNALY